MAPRRCLPRCPPALFLSRLNQRVPQLSLKTGCLNLDTPSADAAGWLVALSCRCAVPLVWESGSQSPEEGHPSAAASVWCFSVPHHLPVSATLLHTCTQRHLEPGPLPSVGGHNCSHSVPITGVLNCHSQARSKAGGKCLYRNKQGWPDDFHPCKAHVQEEPATSCSARK